MAEVPNTGATPNYGLNDYAPQAEAPAIPQPMARSGTEFPGQPSQGQSPWDMPIQTQPQEQPAGSIPGGFDAASMGLKAVQLGADIYDKYQQRDQAKKNYEMMLAEYNRRQGIETEDRQREQGRLERQENYFISDSARNLGNELAATPQGYRKGSY
jgi:hypothetical protein